MHGNGNITTQGPRRVGGASATLLFVVALIAGFAVVAATWVFLGRADTVAAFVPANAMLYAHANGRAASQALLSTSRSLPAGVRPDEVAVFIVPGDESPRHGALLAWRWPLRPTDDERAALDARGADALDDRRFLIDDGSLGTASRVAMAAHASFADDRARTDALGLLRSAFPLQIYASPSELLSAGDAELLAGLQEAPIGPLVAGVTAHDGAFMVRAMPLADAAERASFFGYRASPSDVARPDVSRLDADVMAAETAPTFDLAKLLVASDASADNPDPAMLAAAGDELRVAFASPYALWLRPGEDRMSYLIWFPHVPAQTARRAAGGFVAAARPSPSPFAMPDGDAAVEYRIGETGPTDGDADTVIGDERSRVLVGPDGDEGSLLATDPALLDAFRRGNERSARRPACPTAGLPSMVSIKDPAHVLARWPTLAGYAQTYKMSDLLVGITVDNEVLLCGYSRGTVDNLGT